MTLKYPFIIGPRLCPAIKIADAHNTAFLSHENGQFVLDLPNGDEHRITGFNPKPLADLQDQFAAILSFLSACAESRKYGWAKYGDPMKGDNSDLFPANAGEWAELMSDELCMLAIELEDGDDDKITA